MYILIYMDLMRGAKTLRLGLLLLLKNYIKIHQISDLVCSVCVIMYSSVSQSQRSSLNINSIIIHTKERPH